MINHMMQAMLGGEGGDLIGQLTSALQTVMTQAARMDAAIARIETRLTEMDNLLNAAGAYEEMLEARTVDFDVEER